MSFHRVHITNVNGISELYDKVVDFIENTLGWTKKKTGTSQTGKPYAIFFSEGESEQETIYIGLTYYYYSEDSCGVQFCGYTGFDSGRGFDDNLGHIDTSYDSGRHSYTRLPTFGILQNTTYSDLWLLGDKDCCLGVVKCITIYRCFYAGLLRRYWSMQYDPYPVYLFGSFVNGDTPGQYVWTNGYRNQGFGGCYDCYTRNWIWYSQDSWTCGLIHRDCCNDCCFYYNNRGNQVMITHPFMQKQYLQDSSKYSICPFLVSDWTGVRGEMKWVYRLSYAHDLNPEDELEIGGNTYKVFPSDADLSLWRWYAIRWYD